MGAKEKIKLLFSWSLLKITSWVFLNYYLAGPGQFYVISKGTASLLPNRNYCIFYNFDLKHTRSLETSQSCNKAPQGFPQVLWRWGGLLKIWWGNLSQNMGRAWGNLKCCQKYLWWSPFDSKLAGYKPASLQIY